MKQELIIEYAKYLNDPCYFIEKNLRVFDMTQTGYVPFKLFDFQKESIEVFHNNRYALTRKTRQAGMSTVTQAYLAYVIAMSTKESPEKIYILANKLTAAKKFFKGVRDFLEHVPQWVWGENIDHNKKKEKHVKGQGSTMTLQFHNGSEMHCMASSADAIRGVTASILLIDECAFCPDPDMYKASVIATSTGGKCFLISTPNGMDQILYKCYQESLNGENDYKIVLAHWVLDPRYNVDLEWIEKDENDNEISRHTETNFDYEYLKEKITSEKYYPTSSWFRNMAATLNHDERMIAQELLCQFVGSGGNVIKQNSIKYYEYTSKNIKYKKVCFDENGWLFKSPIEGHKYIAGADTSTGDGTDYNTYSIVDLDTMELVFEYRGKCSQDQFATIILKYGNLYNALTVVDTTGGYGDVLIHLLEKAEFKHLYYEEFIEDVKVKDKGKEHLWKKKKKKAGFKIQRYRPAAISHYVSMVNNKSILIPSIRHINEWNTYIWVNGRADHQYGFNDDLIMSVVMALWIAESVYNKIEKVKKTDEAIRKHFLGFGVTMEDLNNAVASTKGENIYIIEFEKGMNSESFIIDTNVKITGSNLKDHSHYILKNKKIVTYPFMAKKGDEIDIQLKENLGAFEFNLFFNKNLTIKSRQDPKGEWSWLLW